MPLTLKETIFQLTVVSVLASLYLKVAVFDSVYERSLPHLGLTLLEMNFNSLSVLFAI